ncbi:hypothetical protein EVAR_45990_1 [Eumeta japonica]|uniref:Uncharacterized protein n=1 Tax=Eumeta variegata TaxID=151549 RepID=A0A4C1X9Q7_EUMVA|nr:hypothetical protein EVAR_45990_1 [Eumeta japonica]
MAISYHINAHGRVNMGIEMVVTRTGRSGEQFCMTSPAHVPPAPWLSVVYGISETDYNFKRDKEIIGKHPVVAPSLASHVRGRAVSRHFAAPQRRIKRGARPPLRLGVSIKHQNFTHAKGAGYP